MTGAEFAGKLVAWVVGGRTGAIEWRDERRRRLCFFAKGELVLLQSNLKSESPARVAELSGLDGEPLRHEVSHRRLHGLLTETTGVLTEHPDVPAPELAPEDVFSLLLASASVFPRAAGYPSVGRLAVLQRLPVAPEVTELLVELDGDRSVDDLLAFSPVDPERLSDALAVANALGALVCSAHPMGAARVTAVPPGPDDEATDLEQHLLESSDPRVHSPPVGGPGPVAVPRQGATLPPVASPPPSPTPTPAASPAPSPSPVAPAPGPSPVVPPPSTSPEPPPHEVVLARAPTLDSTLGAAAARIRKAHTHFEVLGVTPDMTHDVGRRAYLQLAKELHPDRWTNAQPAERAEAERVFQRVREAWEVLGLESSRKAYVDRVIHGKKSEEELAQERIKSIMDGELDFKRGVTELNGGRLTQAHELFQRARARLPDDDEVLCHAAYTTFKLNHGRNEEKAASAASEIEEAVRRNERLDHGVYFLGMIAWARGDEATARERFIAALRIRPANPDALRELKRLQRSAEAPRSEATKEKEGEGFFSKLFKKK